MNNYVYTYHSDRSANPSQEGLRAWGEWMESLGDHLVDGGNPIVEGAIVLKDGKTLKGQKDTLLGYSIVRAESLEQAAKLAKGNPLSNAPGCEVRVYETGQM